MDTGIDKGDNWWWTLEVQILIIDYSLTALALWHYHADSVTTTMSTRRAYVDGV
jgi:hypothetical protein